MTVEMVSKQCQLKEEGDDVRIPQKYLGSQQVSHTDPLVWTILPGA